MKNVVVTKHTKDSWTSEESYELEAVASTWNEDGEQLEALPCEVEISVNDINYAQGEVTVKEQPGIDELALRDLAEAIAIEIGRVQLELSYKDENGDSKKYFLE